MKLVDHVTKLFSLHNYERKLFTGWNISYLPTIVIEQHYYLYIIEVIYKYLRKIKLTL